MSAVDEFRETDRSVTAGVAAVTIHLALTGSHDPPRADR